MKYPLDEIEHEGEGSNSHAVIDGSNNPAIIDDHDSIIESVHNDYVETVRQAGKIDEQRTVSKAMYERPASDIGSYDQSEDCINGQTLRSNEKAVINEIYGNIVPAQVTASSLAFAPSWITEMEMRKEDDENWIVAYEEVRV